MKTYTQLEVESLIATVQSKFQTQRDRIQSMVLEYDYWVFESLDTVEAEVAQVIREWTKEAETRVAKENDEARIRGFDQGSEWGKDRHWS